VTAPNRPIVARLAPSPTGGLHVGHARTFLIAWLAARSVGGRVVLRIEDIDTSRVRPGATECAMADLRWLGLDWDAGPFLQSARTDLYREALAGLEREDLVYPCTCTRAEIARAASAPHADDEGPTYPGTCAHHSAAEADRLDRPFAWRFRTPRGDVAWNDLVKGRTSLDPSRLGGDFLLARSPFGPSYQLAVVVDDLAMGVTQVVRGDDLIPSTPRQILLARALGGAPPDYGHVPLVIGPDGHRLAKRDGSIKLATLRESGLDPRRLIGWVAHSCGWTDRVEPSDARDWVGRFDRATIPDGPCVFDVYGVSFGPANHSK
jgi:glutamyl-tRNA synthetase